VGGAGCQNVNGTYVDDHATINGRMVGVFSFSFVAVHISDVF
jgi:hypothetical protein